MRAVPPRSASLHYDLFLRVIVVAEHHEGTGYGIPRVCAFGFWEGVCAIGTGFWTGCHSGRHIDTLELVVGLGLALAR